LSAENRLRPEPVGLNSNILLSRATGMAAAVSTEPELQTRMSTLSCVMSWLIIVVEVAGWLWSS